MIKILVYEDEKGKEPFTDYLKSVDKTVRSKIFAKLDRVELGNMGDCKAIGDKIFELRLHFGSGYRIYFGKIDNCVVLLLTAGDKSTQKKDIKKAKYYWEKYQRSELK